MIGDLGPEFDDFVARDAGRALGFAVLLVDDRHRAEDLLQTALARTARRWRTASANPEAYLRTVLVNLARDGWRRAGRRPAELLGLDQSAPEPSPSAVSPGPDEQVVDRQVLLAACRQLPVQQRAVLVLRFWEDRSVEETAALLGISAGTVKSHTSRALARLRELVPAPHPRPLCPVPLPTASEDRPC